MHYGDFINSKRGSSPVLEWC